MNRPTFRVLLLAVMAGMLAACASDPNAVIKRSPPTPATAQAGVAGTSGTSGTAKAEPLPPDQSGPTPVIRRGTGQVINRSAASAPPPRLGGTTGQATFNFEGESVPAVVKAILGDMLGQNYVIAPGVQGTVTLATPKPVSPAEAMSLLEMVLGWNNARMVYADGRYNIVPADQSLAGTVAPRTGSPAMARGFESRVVPLKYISAAEMEKILKPYARKDAIVNVDSGRNVITVAGTRAELENYLRTIQIFDVDWMSSMSVGVFPLQTGRASQVVADLEKVFGEQSKSPVAGMFRFMPLEAANAVLVITPQADYLDDIRQWLDRIDSAGGGVQLFTYELKYIKAKDLADRLADVFGGGGNRGEQNTGQPSLMPGLNSTEIRDAGIDSTNGISSAQIGGNTPGGTGSAGDTGTSGSMGTMSLPQQTGGGNGTVTLQVNGDRVGVSAVDETNSLLVRATPQAWHSIREVVERLDVMPLQVQIEAQVVEVTLTGDLKYGVNWYFEQAVNAPVASGGAGLPSALGRTIWGDISGSVTTNGVAWTFLGRNAAAVINALDSITDLKLLQTPSVIVRNNADAMLNVGTRIPIESVTVNSGTGTSTTFGQVQYLDTGVILKVRPRITRDGMVFLDLVQEVSSAGSLPARCTVATATNTSPCNPPINTRKLQTEAAVHSGDTVMLAGLISDGTTKGSSGFPGLNRLPIIGGLFGTQTSTKNRSEVVVLLTPTVLRNQQEANDMTDEYGRRFRALEPLYRTPGGK
jgi:general secretion pathway protein D